VTSSAMTLVLADAQVDPVGVAVVPVEPTARAT
jgi:hypothetical protein